MQEIKGICPNCVYVAQKQVDRMQRALKKDYGKVSEETYSARTMALGKGIAELYRMQEQVTFSVGVEAGLSGDDGNDLEISYQARCSECAFSKRITVTIPVMLKSEEKQNV